MMQFLVTGNPTPLCVGSDRPTAYVCIVRIRRARRIHRRLCIFKVPSSSRTYPYQNYCSHSCEVNLKKRYQDRETYENLRGAIVHEYKNAERFYRLDSLARGFANVDCDFTLFEITGEDRVCLCRNFSKDNCKHKTRDNFRTMCCARGCVSFKMISLPSRIKRASIYSSYQYQSRVYWL